MAIKTATVCVLLACCCCLLQCAAQDNYEASMTDDEHYLRKRSKPHVHSAAHRSYNFHKCCLETGDHFCCDMIRVGSPPESEEEDDDSFGFLRVGVPNRHQSPLESELQDLVAQLDSPRERERDREGHWKSRRIDKKFY